MRIISAFFALSVLVQNCAPTIVSFWATTTPNRTPLYAVADGVVRINGSHAAYSDGVIQVRHDAVGGGTLYAVYLHVDECVVDEEQAVAKGDLVGYSGASVSGFEHLHFELREGLFQRNCTNPWIAFAYFDGTSAQATSAVPRLQRAASATLDASTLQYDVAAQCEFQSAQLDLNVLSVRFIAKADGSSVLADAAHVDFIALNQANEGAAELLDNDTQTLRDGLRARIVPDVHSSSSTQSSVGIEFEQLLAEAPSEILIAVRCGNLRGVYIEKFYALTQNCTSLASCDALALAADPAAAASGGDASPSATDNAETPLSPSGALDLTSFAAPLLFQQQIQQRHLIFFLLSLLMLSI